MIDAPVGNEARVANILETKFGIGSDPASFPIIAGEGPGCAFTNDIGEIIDMTGDPGQAMKAARLLDPNMDVNMLPKIVEVSPNVRPDSKLVEINYLDENMTYYSTQDELGKAVVFGVAGATILPLFLVALGGYLVYKLGGKILDVVAEAELNG